MNTENIKSNLADGEADAIRGETGRTESRAELAVLMIEEVIDTADQYTIAEIRGALRTISGVLSAPSAPADKAEPVAAATFVLSDVDPVVLEVWKLQGRKVGAMLSEAQNAVVELQEALADAAPPTALREAMQALKGARAEISYFRRHAPDALPAGHELLPDKIVAIDAALVKLREQLGEQG